MGSLRSLRSLRSARYARFARSARYPAARRAGGSPPAHRYRRPLGCVPSASVLGVFDTPRPVARDVCFDSAGVGRPPRRSHATRRLTHPPPLKTTLRGETGAPVCSPAGTTSPRRRLRRRYSPPSVNGSRRMRRSHLRPRCPPRPSRPRGRNTPKQSPSTAARRWFPFGFSSGVAGGAGFLSPSLCDGARARSGSTRARSRRGGRLRSLGHSYSKYGDKIQR